MSDIVRRSHACRARCVPEQRSFGNESRPNVIVGRMLSLCPPMYACPRMHVCSLRVLPEHMQPSLVGAPSGTDGANRRNNIYILLLRAVCGSTVFQPFGKCCFVRHRWICWISLVAPTRRRKDGGLTVAAQ